MNKVKDREKKLRGAVDIEVTNWIWMKRWCTRMRKKKCGILKAESRTILQRQSFFFFLSFGSIYKDNLLSRFLFEWWSLKLWMQDVSARFKNMNIRVKQRKIIYFKYRFPSACVCVLIYLKEKTFRFAISASNVCFRMCTPSIPPNQWPLTRTTINCFKRISIFKRLIFFFFLYIFYNNDR